QKRDHTQRTEPPGLVIRRSHGEIERSAGLVPHAAVVAGHDAEAIIARRQIVIERLATRAGILPVMVEALQPEAKENFLPGHEAQIGVIKREMSDMWRQTQSARSIVGLRIRPDLFDVYWRWKLVDGQTLRIDNAEGIERYEPYFSVRSSGHRPRIPA